MTVRAAVEQCGKRTQGLATWSQLRAAGLSDSTLSRAVRAGAVHRTGRGVYSASALPPVPRPLLVDGVLRPAYVAHVRAALLILGPAAAAAGRTAALLRGWPLLVEPLLIEAAVPHGRGRAGAPGTLVQQRRGLRVEDLPVLPGQLPVPVTAAAESAMELCLRRPTLEAVVAVDSALRSGQVEMDELAYRAATLPGVRHSRRARDALRLADARCESVLESVMRVRLIGAGLGGFAPQYVIASGHRHVLRVDFCFVEHGLVVEVDGERWHADRDKDRRTDNALMVLGWRVLRYSWLEVVHDPAPMLEEIKAALGARLPRPPAAG